MSTVRSDTQLLGRDCNSNGRTQNNVSREEVSVCSGCFPSFDVQPTRELPKHAMYNEGRARGLFKSEDLFLCTCKDVVILL